MLGMRVGMNAKLRSASRLSDCQSPGQQPASGGGGEGAGEGIYGSAGSAGSTGSGDAADGAGSALHTERSEDTEGLVTGRDRPETPLQQRIGSLQSLPRRAGLSSALLTDRSDTVSDAAHTVCA